MEVWKPENKSVEEEFTAAWIQSHSHSCNSKNERYFPLSSAPCSLARQTDRLKKIKPNSWKAGVEMPTKEPATGVRRANWGEGKWATVGSGRVGLLECGGYKVGQRALPLQVELAEWAFPWQPYWTEDESPPALNYKGCSSPVGFCDPWMREQFPQTQVKIFTAFGGCKQRQINLI